MLKRLEGDSVGICLGHVCIGYSTILCLSYPYVKLNTINLLQLTYAYYTEQGWLSVALWHSDLTTLRASQGRFDALGDCLPL